MTSDPAQNTLLSIALCIAFVMLVPFAIAGLALINAGLGRSRSAAHAMTASLCVICVAVLVYFVWGFAVQGFPSKLDLFGGLNRGMIAAPGLFLRRVDFRVSIPALAVLLGLFSVGLASLIPLGAAADRLRLSAACASTALLAGCT